MKTPDQIAEEAADKIRHLPDNYERSEVIDIIEDAIEEAVTPLQDAVNASAEFMDFLRSNVGFTDDWPMEIKVALDTVPKVNDLLNKFESKVYELRK